MEAFEAKMKQDGLGEAAIAAFKMNYEALISGASTEMGEDCIQPVESLPTLEEIKAKHNFEAAGDKGVAVLGATAVLKLNGGLGTSMGLEKAKSLLVVQSGRTFLDLIAEQVKFMRSTVKANVRFILMNSFSTSEDTKAALSITHQDLINESDWELVQNKSPKILAEDMTPASFAQDPQLEWCPPGHGDIYASLLGSGMMDRLLSQGIKYVFVSNSDNLGATLDLDLLLYFAENDLPFLMECAARTSADKKGGHLAKKDGKLVLREAAQCPKSDEAAFQDISKYKYFNTNNLWINLEKLKTTMEQHGGVLPLPLIKNSKTVDPRDKSSPKVFQLETAMGAAIEAFQDSSAVLVPRSRFAPVKTCSDLFALRSDAFKLSEDSRVVLDSPHGNPLVKLDDDYYKLVDSMEKHVDAYPSMRMCTSLTVKGPVFFEAGVSLVGDVTVTNETAEMKSLAAGSYQNETVVL